MTGLVKYSSSHNIQSTLLYATLTAGASCEMGTQAVDAAFLNRRIPALRMLMNSKVR